MVIGKGLGRISVEAMTSSICKTLQESIFEAGNSTYAPKGLLYLDTTCHYSRWEGTISGKSSCVNTKNKCVWIFLYIQTFWLYFCY